MADGSTTGNTEGVNLPPSPDSSPVFAKVTRERAGQAQREDVKFSERAEKRKESYETANHLLYDYHEKMKVGLQKQYDELVELQAKGEDKDEIAKKTSEYNKQKNFVEAVGLASNVPGRSRRGTEQKVVALIGISQQLIDQLAQAKAESGIDTTDVSADVLGLPGRSLRISESLYNDRKHNNPEGQTDLTNSLATDLIAANAAMRNLDELLRTQRSAKERIGKWAGDRIARALGRGQFILPEQRDYSTITREAITAAQNDSRSSESGKPADNLRAFVSQQFAQERQAIYQQKADQDKREKEAEQKRIDSEEKAKAERLAKQNPNSAAEVKPGTPPAAGSAEATKPAEAKTVMTEAEAEAKLKSLPEEVKTKAGITDEVVKKRGALAVLMDLLATLAEASLAAAQAAVKPPPAQT